MTLQDTGPIWKKSAKPKPSQNIYFILQNYTNTSTIFKIVIRNDLRFEQKKVVNLPMYLANEANATLQLTMARILIHFHHKVILHNWGRTACRHSPLSAFPFAVVSFRKLHEPSAPLHFLECADHYHSIVHCQYLFSQISSYSQYFLRDKHSAG